MAIVIKATKIEIGNKLVNEFVGYLKFFDATGRSVWTKDKKEAIHFDNEKSCVKSNGQIAIVNESTIRNLPIEKWKYEHEKVG